MKHALTAHQVPQQNILSAALQTFHLPSIHMGIPRKALLNKYDQNKSELGMALVEAGVINPDDIHESVTTPHEIIETGLAAWFDRRISKLKVVEFSMHLLDGNAASEFMEQQCDNTERELTGNYALQIIGSSQFCYELKTQAIELENSCPGLFKSALDAITIASYRTINIMLPDEILDCFARDWESDCSNFPTDEEVMETMIERFGDSDAVKNYLPSVIVPLLGGELCLPSTRSDKKSLLNKKQLRKFAKQTKHEKSAAVAIQTAILLDEIAKAKKSEARFPDMHMIFTTCTERGCVLIYESDDRVFQMLDEIVENAWNGGDGTECLGIQELPTSVEDIKIFFQKLDLACSVLRHMDTLISMIISEPEGN